MLMLDLGSGLKGASQAMVERGWQVVTVDINPEFEPDIVSDLREFSWNGPRPDLVWCSPPCDQFAKFAMWCWYDVSKLPKPDMSLVLSCKRIVNECNPRYWIIENVAGAKDWFRPVLGNPTLVLRPYYFWGHFPDFGDIRRTWGKKTKHLPSTAKAERAKVPAEISRALALAVEHQAVLPGFPPRNLTKQIL